MHSAAAVRKDGTGVRRRGDVDMLNGPVFKSLFIYTVPLLLSGILQLLYNAADVAVVGRFASDGEKALAAVGSTGSLTNLIVSLFMGLSVGTNILVAHYLGAGRERDVSETVHTAVLSSFILGGILTVFGTVFARDFLTIMGNPDDVIDWATLYIRIYFLGLPFNMAYNFGGAILRAKGNTRFPLITLVVSGLVNVVLNLIFVILLRLDVAGVAVATVISQALSAAMTLIYLARLHDCCRLVPRQLKIHRDKLLKMARYGVPAGLQGSFFSLSNVVVQSAVNSLGRIAMAGNTAAANIDGFIYITGNSVYHGALSFTGQNFGACKFERIKKIYVCSLLLVVLYTFLLGAGSVLFAEPLLSIYAPGADNADVRAYGLLRLSIMGPTYFLCGLMEVATGMLRGIGTSVRPMVISMVGTVVVRIGWIKLLFYKVEYFHSMFWLYFSYPISWLFTFGLQLLAFAIFYRKAVEKRMEEEELRAAGAKR